MISLTLCEACNKKNKLIEVLVWEATLYRVLYLEQVKARNDTCE